MNDSDFQALKVKLLTFMQEDIYPNEEEYMRQCAEYEHTNQWTFPEILVRLKKKAKSKGLWNLFLPVDSAAIAGREGGGLTNRQYGELCEIMGTTVPMEFAAQCTNCTSPDTGNMEVLARFGTEEQKKRWLEPLLKGDIRSAFAMTEPDVASSDATNISISIKREGQNYVINGKKWWITGVGSLHCQIMILMGKTNPDAHIFGQQSMILVPMNTPGITLLRPLRVFGDPEAPKGHFEIEFKNVRVPLSNVILKEGAGFAIAQSRLGPGRIHHCMRTIGQAERCLSALCERAGNRKAFRRTLTKFATIRQDIAKSRAEIDQARLLVLQAADYMDKYGNKDSRTRQLLSLVKAVCPTMLQRVCDRAMQAHGAMGICQDSFLPLAWIGARCLRFADGPDEVHWRKAAELELKAQKNSPLRKFWRWKFEEEPFRRSTDPISPKAQREILRAKF